MDGASIGFDCPPRTHGHHVRGKLAGQSMMGMGSMECLVQMGLCMIRWPNGRSEQFFCIYWGWVLVRSTWVASGMGSWNALVQMGLCMIRWPNGRSEPFGYNIGCSL